MTPKQRAQYDFIKGGGQADNPYKKNSEEYKEYMWEMARLWNDDFRNDMGVWV